MKLTSILIILLFAFTLAACGGGGSSSTGMNGNGGMATMCPEGQTGTPPDCITPTPGPSQAQIDAEAMRVAGALGNNAKVSLESVAHDAPLRGEMMGKIMDDEKPTGYKSDTDATYTPLGGNWVSNAYKQTNQAGNVVLEGVLYNNVEDPTARRYAEFLGTGGAGLEKPYVTGADVDDDENGLVTFAVDIRPAADSDKFMFRGAHVSANSNFDIPGVNDPETPGVDTDVVGSFFGIEGKFTCATPAGCNVRANSKGALAVTGVLTFTPDGFVAGEAADPTSGTSATGTMVQGVVADSDYMVFGYWLEKTTARDGTMTYEVEVYSRGEMSYDISDSVGTATYEGPATGLYMKKTVDPNGDPTSPFSSGQFTADAMLTASFGGDTVGDAHHDTVTGTITNFMDSSGDSISDWTLTLKRNTSATAEQATAGTFSGMTYGYKDGDAEGPLGDFAGSFHGPERDDSDSDNIMNPHPASAVGTFNGHFKNGHVAGAFGATLQE